MDKCIDTSYFATTFIFKSSLTLGTNKISKAIKEAHDVSRFNISNLFCLKSYIYLDLYGYACILNPSH